VALVRGLDADVDHRDGRARARQDVHCEGAGTVGQTAVSVCTVGRNAAPAHTVAHIVAHVHTAPLVVVRGRGVSAAPALAEM